MYRYITDIPQFASAVCCLRLTIFFWALMQVVETWIRQTRHLLLQRESAFAFRRLQVLSSMQQDDCVWFPQTWHSSCQSNAIGIESLFPHFCHTPPVVNHWKKRWQLMCNDDLGRSTWCVGVSMPLLQSSCFTSKLLATYRWFSRPDQYTYTAAIQSCERSGDIQHAQAVINTVHEFENAWKQLRTIEFEQSIRSRQQSVEDHFQKMQQMGILLTDVVCLWQCGPNIHHWSSYLGKIRSQRF